MKYINKIELCGVVGRVSEMDGLYTFSLMTESSYKCKDSVVTDATWFNCKACDLPGLGEIKRGSKVHLFGRFENYKYLGKDGEERSFYTVIVTDFKMIYE